MKLYLVWESSRGAKDLATICLQESQAKAFCKSYNDYCLANNVKARAYIVEYKIGYTYNHKEMKED